MLKKILFRFSSAALSFCLSVLLMAASRTIPKDKTSIIRELNQSAAGPQVSAECSAGSIIRSSDCQVCLRIKKSVKPQYPSLGRAVRLQGNVDVEIEVDADGKVITAIPISGPQLLRASSVAAAIQFEFEPVMLGGARVSVHGLLTFRFTFDEREHSDTYECQTN